MNAYGPGTHSWPYWQRELHDALPMLLEALGESIREPSPSPSAPATGWAALTGTSWCDFSAFPTIGCVEQASDPRVSGTSTRTITMESPSSDSGDALIWTDVTIVGPDGSWTGMGYAVMDRDGWGHGVEISTGSGAYQGLVYATSTTITPSGNGTFIGLMQPGSSPPGFPVPPTTPDLPPTIPSPSPSASAGG